jgi:hypothetical protein
MFRLKPPSSYPLISARGTGGLALPLLILDLLVSRQSLVLAVAVCTFPVFATASFKIRVNCGGQEYQHHTLLPDSPGLQRAGYCDKV